MRNYKLNSQVNVFDLVIISVKNEVNPEKITRQETDYKCSQ